ncbi:MAG: tetratricopeptide repeat protein [Bacteroidota bacterium]
MILRVALIAGLFLGTAASEAQVWDVPLDTLEARVQRQPEDLDARRALADRLIGEGALDAAILHLRWIVNRTPEDVDRHLALARAFSWTDKPAEAIAAYDRLLEVAPGHDPATLELATLLLWNEGPARAAQLFGPMAERQPDDPEIQNLYAYALHGAKRSREARAQYNRALRLSPDNPQLLAESGSLERWEGDWSLGRYRLSRALQLGLDGEAAERARAQLRELSRTIAPRVTLSIEHAADSNGLTRTRYPSHAHVQFTPSWAAGVTITQERLTQALPLTELPSIDAAATFVYPYIAYSPIGPLAFRAYAGLQDVHSEGSGVSGALEAEWRQTSPRFLRSILRFQSDASLDGVRALGEGIRSTQLVSDTYAEPLPGWGFGVGVTGVSYSDGNERLNLATSTRVTLARWPQLELAVTGGGGFETTSAQYENSDPYWTPRNLVTLLGGGTVAVTPIQGVKLEPEVYGAYQRDAFNQAISLGLRLRATLERGRHRAGLLVEEWGSDVYSVQRFGLRYEVGLW